MIFQVTEAVPGKGGGCKTRNKVEERKVRLSHAALLSSHIAWVILTSARVAQNVLQHFLYFMQNYRKLLQFSLLLVMNVLLDPAVLWNSTFSRMFVRVVKMAW
jgi:hypothetical protein